MRFSQGKSPKYKGWPLEVPDPGGPQGDVLQREGKERLFVKGSSLFTCFVVVVIS